MRDTFRKIILDTDVHDFGTLKEVVLMVLKDHADNGGGKIGYVAGIITSDGDEYMARNRLRLEQYTQEAREKVGFPIFSATDIFTDDLYEKMKVHEMPRGDSEGLFQEFWRTILESGYITNIYMTPRWEKSMGATDEHKSALKVGLTITYLD